MATDRPWESGPRDGRLDNPFHLPYEFKKALTDQVAADIQISASQVTGLTASSGTTLRKNDAKDIVSSTTETDLMNDEFTLPALSATSIVRVTLVGDYFNNSGAVRTLTLRVKLGGTALWGDVSDNLAVSATRRPWRMQFEIVNQDSAAVQWLGGVMWFGTAAPGAASVAGIGEFTTVATVTASPSVFAATGTIDTSTAQTLTVTATHSASNASLSVRLEAALVEIL